MSRVISQTIILNSVNRKPNETPSNFSSSISLDYDFEYVCLRGCSIPKTMYLIDPRHDTFNLIESASTHTITITNGNYDVYELLKEILFKINDVASYSYTGTFSLTTGKFTFNVTGNSSYQPTIDLLADNRLKNIFGFNTISKTFTADSLTSDRVVNLQLTNSIGIISNIVEKQILSEIFAQTVVSYGTIAYVEQNTEYNYRKLIERRPKSINIRLIDLENDGETLDLNGHDVVISLTFFNIPKSISESYYEKKMIEKRIELSDINDELE